MCYVAEVVELLLQNGADANALTKESYAPLHIAADCGSVQVISQNEEFYS